MMQLTENQNNNFTDVLIVGVGIAGLTPAIKLGMRQQSIQQKRNNDACHNPGIDKASEERPATAL